MTYLELPLKLFGAGLYTRYISFGLFHSGMEVVAGARIAFPYLLKVNAALLGTSEYERDFNYFNGRPLAVDTLEQVSPEEANA